MTSDAPSGFWSRRRAAVAAEAEADARAAQAERNAETEERLAARPDEEILAELDLPAPEEMDHPDQVQKLLKAAVPQRLRTRALRRLWRLNPVLANLDGLVDYGEDYTDASRVVENLQTLYQVGKGMFDKVAEEAAAGHAGDTADKSAPDEAEAPDPVRGHVAQDALPSDETQIPPEPARPGPDPGPNSADTSPDPQAPAAPRRMRFRFETAT